MREYLSSSDPRPAHTQIEHFFSAKVFKFTSRASHQMRLLQLAFIVALTSGLAAIYIYTTGVSDFCKCINPLIYMCVDLPWKESVLFSYGGVDLVCRWAAPGFGRRSGSVPISAERFSKVRGEFSASKFCFCFSAFYEIESFRVQVNAAIS